MPADRRDIRKLREIALNVLRRRGLDPQKIPGRKQLYRLADGTTALLRAAAEGRLVTNAAGFAVDDVMDLEEGDEAWVVAAIRRGDGKVEVYMPPKLRVVADMRTSHGASPPNRSDVRNINFDGDPERPGYGFRTRYAEFLLEVVDLTEPPRARPAQSAAALASNDATTALMDQLARTIAADLDMPPERVQITISVMFDSGELSFHWRPHAHASQKLTDRQGQSRDT